MGRENFEVVKRCAATKLLIAKNYTSQQLNCPHSNISGEHSLDMHLHIRAFILGNVMSG